MYLYSFFVLLHTMVLKTGMVKQQIYVPILNLTWFYIGFEWFYQTELVLDS